MKHNSLAAALLFGAAVLTGCGGGGSGPDGGDAAGRGADAGTPPRTAPEARSEGGSPPERTSTSRPEVGSVPARPGSVRGRVVYDGPLPERRPLAVVKDVAVCRKIDHLDDRLVVGPAGGIRDAVVSIRGVRGARGLDALGSEFVLDQRSCAYLPHVLLVPVDAPLRILNSDGVLHNIHTYSRANRPFNLAQPKTLLEIERRFSAPERIGVRCDVHGWMSSWVIVVDDPYHAVSDVEGRFAVEGVPPGRYTALCWQESLGELSVEIEVGAEGAVHDFRYAPPGGGG